MLVCDCEDEWNIYMYSDYLEDIEDVIEYRYDDKNNLFTFLDNNGNVLWEGKLPEWTNEYAYTDGHFKIAGYEIDSYCVVEEIVEEEGK